MSERCVLSAQSFNVRYAHPERKVVVEVTGYFKDILICGGSELSTAMGFIPELKKQANIVIPRTYHRQMYGRGAVVFPLSVQFVLISRTWCRV